MLIAPNLSLCQSRCRPINPSPFHLHLLRQLIPNNTVTISNPWSRSEDELRTSLTDHITKEDSALLSRELPETASDPATSQSTTSNSTGHRTSCTSAHSSSSSPSPSPVNLHQHRGIHPLRLHPIHHRTYNRRRHPNRNPDDLARHSYDPVQPQSSPCQLETSPTPLQIQIFSPSTPPTSLLSSTVKNPSQVSSQVHSAGITY